MGFVDQIAMESQDVSPHVVIVTVPCPGHIIPSTQLAKYLLSLGVTVSCFSTGMNYPSVESNLEERFLDARIQFLPLIKDIEFVAPGKEITNNISWMQSPSDDDMAVRLEETVRSLTPPPACIISDLLAGWSQDVADRLHIPRHVLYTMPANALLFMLAGLPSLVSPQVAPKHPPGTWNSMVDTTHAFHDYMTRNARRLPEAAFILVNTFEDLEGGFLELMRTEVIGKPNVQMQKLLSIGPLIRSSGREIASANSTAESTPREDTSYAEIERWLDSQEQSSVLYVSFGSLLTVNEMQVHELAYGLERSGRPFLWVYRAPNAPQVLPTDASAEDSLFNGLPTGFVERVKGRGKLIYGWAPQAKILKHKSVGGFMSHCGWNSTLEALWSGKPLAAWPLAVEQRLTARYFVDDMKLAVEVHKNDDGMVESVEVERAISLLMEGKEGTGIRSRFAKMQELAHMALEEGGTSRTNLKLLVDSIERHLRPLN